MSYDINDAIFELKKLSIDTPKKPVLPSESILEKYANSIGFKFSDDYRKFLLEASDVFVGSINPLIITERGNHPDELSVALNKAREIGVPKEWLPMCEDNGNFYCLTQDGSVHFWAHDGATDESWPTLAAWIKTVWIDQS